MCEFCGCETGRPMKRSSIQQRTTKARTTVRAFEILESSTKAAAGGAEDAAPDRRTTTRQKPILARKEYPKGARRPISE